MTPLTPEYRAARKAEHEAGKHADPASVATTYMYVVGDGFVAGCPLCEAEEEALEAKREAEYAATVKAERKAAREAARLRAAWLTSNPEAIAWRCASCEVEVTDADADQGQGGLFECGECGSTFSRVTPPMVTRTAARSAITLGASWPTSPARSAAKVS